MRARFILISIAFVLFDQAIKWFAQHLLPTEGMFLIPGLLGLELFKNPGIAFGIPVPSLILTGGTALAALIFGVIAVRNRDPRAYLVAAGGCSNAIDRLTHGVTIDYIRLGPWSIINLADVVILLGLALFLIPPKIHRKP